MTTSMVLRSQVLGGRSSAAIPEVETRTDVQFPPETEIENPAEVDFGAARPKTTENRQKSPIYTVSAKK